MQFHRLMQYHILSRAKLKCDFFLCTLQGALSMCPIGIMALIFPIPFNFFEKIVAAKIAKIFLLLQQRPQILFNIE